jgi:hypothetical protein
VKLVPQLLKLMTCQLAQYTDTQPLELAKYMSVDVNAYLQAHAELEREEAEFLAALAIRRLQIIA